MSALIHEEAALARAHGEVLGTGVIRATPVDFRVEEESRIVPDGEGDHWLLWVEKRGASTPWVAEQIAARAGVRSRDVGYAGLKDRHAVTRQWFSVPVSGERSPEQWVLEHARILSAHRHRRKLRKGGGLKGNRFQLVIRDFHPDAEALDRRLGRIAARGVPNYFGPQRFGREGDNAERLLRGRLPRRGNRRGLLLSAGRSWLFNRLLDQRVREASWDTPLAGDLMSLDGSRSFFPLETVDDSALRRCQEADIHPSGPLWGRGPSPAGGDTGVMENALAGEWPELVSRLERAGLDHDRRPLRLCPGELEWSREPGILRLSFRLPAGGFATSVLREILDYSEGHKGDGSDD